MRHQNGLHRVAPVIVDEDIGIPTQVIDEYRVQLESGPNGPADPRALLLSSMSEYDKTQNYDLYGYHSATRPEQAQDFTSFATHPHQYAPEYVGTHAQVSSGLPQASALPLLPPTAHQPFASAHDPAYYAGHPNQQQQHYTTYLDSGPRHLPEVISYTPNQGSRGTKVTVYFSSNYDLDAPPQASIVMMFGQKRCDSVLSKTSHQGSPYQYALTADAPSLASTGGSASESPQQPLSLMFEGSVSWQSPSLEFGSFTYNDGYAAVDSPAAAAAAAITSTRKRKLTPEAAERRSPSKKASYQQLPRADTQAFISAGHPSMPHSSEFHRAGVETYPQPRRFSQPEYGLSQGLPRVQTQQYYGGQPSSASARLQTEPSPATYNYYSSVPSAMTRSPSAAAMTAGGKSSQLLPSPASSNPPLIRTSTLQQSPTTTPVASSATSQMFNPYAMYPANTKAVLKIEGDLNSMVENWNQTEWDAKRRLVQFRRSQQGSIITTTFEPVSLEERLPNSICVSCIWWEEKQECYVTSVDTISLLESLVAVRFTVEEKNRIRRNLEGFRPATVSKTKADSEEFFKLIMGFPNPKPRNIEKDVKVFPWRILSTALKKIIGKYSASYSSTAGALHTSVAPSYAAARVSDAGMIDHRALASPRSISSSSAASHGNVYATTMTTQGYVPQSGGSAGIGSGPSAGPPDLRLAVPSVPNQTTGWHPQAANYGHANAADMSAGVTTGVRNPSTWDFTSYLTGPPVATGLPAPSAQYQFGNLRIPSLSNQAAVPETRFVPLQDYDQQSQQTSGAQ